MNKSISSTWLWLLSVGAITVLLPYFPLLLNSSEALLFRDISNVWLPYKATWLAAWKELQRLPHWDPLHVGGTRFIADLNYGPLYPLNWLLILLEPLGIARALSLFIVFHHLLVYLGFSLLLRSLRVRPWLAVLGGIAFSWSGPCMSADNLIHTLGAQASEGFFFFFWRIALRKQISWAIFAASLALAWPIYSGAPQSGYLTFFFALTMLFGSEISWPRKIRAGLSLGFLTFLVSAPQLLPTAHFLQTDQQILQLSTESERLALSLHPMRSLSLVFPLAFGSNPEEFRGSFLLNGAPIPFIFSFYSGTLAVIFSLLHFFLRPICKRKKGKDFRRAFHRFAWLTMLVIAWGSFSPIPAYALLMKTIPFWDGFRFPERIGLSLSFGLILYGFLGAEKALRLIALHVRLPLVQAWLALALPAIATAGWLIQNSLDSISAIRTLIFGSAFLLCFRFRKYLAMTPILFSLLFFVDQLPIARKLVWTQPVQLTEASSYPWAVKILEERKHPLPPGTPGEAKRFFSAITVPLQPPTGLTGGPLTASAYSVWAGMKFNTPSAWGISLVRGHTSLTPYRPILSLINLSPEVPRKVLDLFSTRYLLISKDGVPAALLNTSAMPYATFPEKVEVFSSSKELLARMKDHDWKPMHSLLIEDTPSISNAPATPPPVVLDWNQHWDRISLRLRLPASSTPRWLLLSEAFDRLWRARFEEEELKIVRANGWSMAIQLPARARAGEAWLDLRYVDVWYVWGFQLLLIWFGLFLLALFFPNRKFI